MALVSGPSSLLEDLIQINLDDLQASFGWKGWPGGRRLVRLLFWVPAARFARQVLAFDRDVADAGLREGARRALPGFTAGVTARGQENIPTRGPLLVLSNHPGMADTLALFATLPRADLRVVGSDRPFLRAMPAVAERMIFVPEKEAGRMETLRSIKRLLAGGGAALTFPAGQIEPDPAVLPGAVSALEGWSESLALFVRMVPDLSIVCAVVSGVLAPQAVFHPVTRLRRQPKDRERLGASIQLLANTLRPNHWPVRPEVAYSRCLPAADLAPLRDPRAIRRAVLDFYTPYLQAACRVD